MAEQAGFFNALCDMRERYIESAGDTFPLFQLAEVAEYTDEHPKDYIEGQTVYHWLPDSCVIEHDFDTICPDCPAWLRLDDKENQWQGDIIEEGGES